MTTETRSNSKLAILPMWVIDRIKEEMRLGPAAWQAITDAVEQAEVPQALPCEVKLPPGTVVGQGSPLSTLLMAIAQRASQPAHAQVFCSELPAPQPHPEPIAWMVGTAFWWTKEEAERDAAATGKTITPFGPMIDTGEVDRLRAALSFYADREHYHFESGNWDTVSGEPLNILWCGEEPDFIEDGSVARAALERKL